MILFTADSSNKTANRLHLGEGERVAASLRWDQIKENSKRAVLYKSNAPDLSPEEARHILKLEECYVNIYSEWEKDNISDEQYKILQDYLPPEYFLNVIAIYICTRFYDLPSTVSEIIEGSFELSEEDKRYFNNYLRIVYKPTVKEFIEKSSSIRPRSEAYNELVQFMSSIFGKENSKGSLSEEENKKVSSLISQLNEGMTLFISCLNNGTGSHHDISEIFEELSPSLEAHIISSRSNAGAVPIETVQAVYPANLLMNSTKAAQNLGEIVELGKGYGYNITPKRKKNSQKDDFLVTVVFEHSNDKLVTLSRPITQTDKNIMDTIETLAQTNSFITASEIYRMMNGGDHIKVTPEIIEEYESRIDYMTDIKATVDYSRHMNLNGKSGEYKLKGPLLNLYKATRKLNGKVVTGYIYIAPSPVFMYAKEVNQIVSVPAVLLNTKSVKRSGERTNNIKFYLLFRLHTIEGQGKTISLDKVLSVIGEENPTARQLRTIREIIENFLDLWSYGKSKTSKSAPDKEILEKSPIKGYSVNTVGKKITGYTLVPKTIVVK